MDDFIIVLSLDGRSVAFFCALRSPDFFRGSFLICLFARCFVFLILFVRAVFLPPGKDENQMKQKERTTKIVTLALLSAMAFVAVALLRVPVVMFLKYEPKDVIITLAGFIFGPLSAMLVSVVTSFVEMIAISDTGPIGLLMNIISTVGFACVASFIYKKKPGAKSAFFGLLAGTVVSTALMLLWNYLITPFYTTMPRSAIADMLVPVFLPFNLLKGGINTALTMMIYPLILKNLKSSRLLSLPEERGSALSKPVLYASMVGLLGVCVLSIVVLWK